MENEISDVIDRIGPAPGPNPLDRLRHTVKVHEKTDPRSIAVMATSGIYGRTSTTGLTYDDLRLILEAHDRLASAAGRALERLEVASDPTGAASEAGDILEQVVQLDGTLKPVRTEAEIRREERERIADVLQKTERERFAIFLPLAAPTAVSDWLRFSDATEIPPEGSMRRPFIVVPGMKEDGLHGVDGFYVVLHGDEPANDDNFFSDREDAELEAERLNEEPA